MNGIDGTELCFLYYPNNMQELKIIIDEIFNIQFYDKHNMFGDKIFITTNTLRNDLKKVITDYEFHYNLTCCLKIYHYLDIDKKIIQTKNGLQNSIFIDNFIENIILLISREKYNRESTGSIHNRITDFEHKSNNKYIELNNKYIELNNKYVELNNKSMELTQKFNECKIKIDKLIDNNEYMTDLK
jgi:hypothetical protein